MTQTEKIIVLLQHASGMLDDAIHMLGMKSEMPIELSPKQRLIVEIIEEQKRAMTAGALLKQCRRKGVEDVNSVDVSGVLWLLHNTVGTVAQQRLANGSSLWRAKARSGLVSGKDE